MSYLLRNRIVWWILQVGLQVFWVATPGCSDKEVIKPTVYYYHITASSGKSYSAMSERDRKSNRHYRCLPLLGTGHVGVTITGNLSASYHSPWVVSHCCQTLYALHVLRSHGFTVEGNLTVLGHRIGNFPPTHTHTHLAELPKWITIFDETIKHYLMKLWNTFRWNNDTMKHYLMKQWNNETIFDETMKHFGM